MKGDERTRTAARFGTIDPAYECMTPAAFGWYLAGLADGEATFGISPGLRNAYRCEFIIHLRADDRPLLEWLRESTGLGEIYVGRRVKIGGDQPSVRWTVARKADVTALVALFERYPLRSKKRKDFEIWADAARAWARQDFGRMAELHQAIKTARLFESAGEEWVFEPDPQLVLEEA